MKIKPILFAATIFILSAVFGFGATEVIDDLSIQNRIVFSDGSVQTNSYTNALWQLETISLWSSNAAFWASNTASWASNAAFSASNTALWASNAAFWSSNRSAWASNAAIWSSNAATWSSNAALWASNRALWASNLAVGISNNYLPLNGSKSMTGNLNFGQNSATNVSSVSFGPSRMILNGTVPRFEFVGDLFIDGGGNELEFTDRGDGNRALTLGYGLTMLNGDIEMGGNNILGLNNATGAIRFQNGTSFGAQSVSNWNAMTGSVGRIGKIAVSNEVDGSTTNSNAETLEFRGDSETNGAIKVVHSMNGTTSRISIISFDKNKYWTKTEEVTNAIPKIDSVDAQAIQANAVGSDEIANGAVTLAKLASVLFNYDIETSGTTLRVVGLLGQDLPSRIGKAGKVLGLDDTTNWTFTAAGVGDMLSTNYSKTNAAQYYVDSAMFARRSSNTTGIVGGPVVTNGRDDETVLVYDLEAPGGPAYTHKSLGSLGYGDMLRATYAPNSITNPSPSPFSDYVDKALFSPTSQYAVIAGNTTGILGHPIVTNGIENATVISYDSNLGRYYHIKLSDLGGGDMMRITFATGSDTNKVNQIATNCIGSANIVDGSITSNDIGNAQIPTNKTTGGFLYTGTSFTGGDMDGQYNSLTVEKLKGHALNFGGTNQNYVMSFTSGGGITSKVDSAITATFDPWELDIDGASNSVTFGPTNKYYFLNITNTCTNFYVGLAAFGNGTLYKLDVLYTSGATFAWGADLLQCTNLPTPPPTGYSSYVFENIAYTTNIVAYP